MIDPLRLAKVTEEIICRKEGDTVFRRYWRFRGGRWYGGIATADCVGCNLRCKFCGPILMMFKTRKLGDFKSPKEVARILVKIARRRKYRYLRISGGEPTLCFEHLIQLISELRDYPYTFILETNGILLGAKKELADALAEFDNIHVRVSLKGADEHEFAELTMASSNFFEYQLNALRHLLDAGVSCHPAVVASFTTREKIELLRERLYKISPYLAESLEIEYIVLYPHVIESLLKHDLVPTKAYTTDWQLIDSKGYKEYIRKFF